MGFQISLCNITRTVLGKGLLTERCKSVRCINTTHGNFSECFFPVLTEDIFFFTIALYGLPNITLQIPQEQSYRKACWGKSCNSVRWINRTQSGFSESFFPVLNGSYFLSHHTLYGLPNIPLPIPQEQRSRKASWREGCNSVRWINRTQSSFSECFFPVLDGRYFLFHHSPLWFSKYPFANSTRTAFAKGFLKGKM